MELQIKELILANSEELFGQQIQEGLIQFQKTRKDVEGDLTLVTFPFVKILKKSPQEVGETIGSFLTEKIDSLSEFNVIGGFLNFIISDSHWVNVLNDLDRDANYGFATKKSKPTLMVEYSSPNTNKPLHLGHLRNNFLGYSVAKILEANGYNAIKTQIINDRGIHICKSMLAWQKFGNGETPDSKGVKGDKFVGDYYVKFDQEYKKEIQQLVDGGQSKEEAEQNAPLIQEAREMLIEMANAVSATVATYEDTVEALRDLSLGGETKVAKKKVMQLIKEVNLKEHEADEVEAKAAAHVFTSGDDDALAAMHMYRVLQRMDDVANACEKAANAFIPLLNR